MRNWVSGSLMASSLRLFHWFDLHLIIYILLIILSTTIIPRSTANSQDYWGSYCDNSTSFEPNSQYHTNLKNLFASLSNNAVSNPTGFFQTYVGASAGDAAYGLFLCRGDVDISSCAACVSTANSELPTKYCLNKKTAVVWYDDCMIRYSNQSFFYRVDLIPGITLRNVIEFKGNMTKFEDVVIKMLDKVSTQVASRGSEKKFYTDTVDYNSTQRLYGLGQCTPDLSANDCNSCLMNALVALPITWVGARVYMPSCNIRYELYPFFLVDQRGVTSRCNLGLSPESCEECLRNAKGQLSSENDKVSLPGCSVEYKQPMHNNATTNSSVPQPRLTVNGNASKRKILGISLSITLPISMLLFLGFCIWMRLNERKAVKLPYFNIDEIRTMESLQYDLNTVQATTNNFSQDCKLGEGGFGEVYKGIFEGGQEIAVKRLSKSSGQGVDEFKTEVLLVARLQHKNLVKLLGFCVDSTEKILIYEYLQNSSLDKLLFDRIKRVSFDWKMRFKVIVGIARGLMYLYEDSRLKIIHRDLKPSNILLDDNMNPKISDFGLARLFEVDETQADTKRIVGTYGYMAPEYAMTGHFSDKSDIYSFGVIILEIVSGQRNRFFGRTQLEEALLHRAWRLWNEKTILDLMDTALGNKYPKEEVAKCIHIGLLCIQENPIERPRMTTIIAALTGQSISLPLPKAPNFFGNTNVAADMASAHYGPPMAGGEIEYRRVMDDHEGPCMYSGTNDISILSPR